MTNVSVKILILITFITIINQVASYFNKTINTQEFVPKFESNKEHFNATKILDDLLIYYDRDIRPLNRKGSPTKINVDIYVRSMSKISELDSEFTFNCYFRQSWVDRRLSFNYGPEMIIVNIKMLEKIWRPYTYFANSNFASMHKIPSANKFFRINRDGTVLYSMRLTITGKCPMDLKYFPIDLQKCPLYISSFIYSSQEVIYSWKKSKLEKKAIIVAKDMQMSQFDLLGTDEQAINIRLNFKNSSCLIGIFKFKRQLNYFIIQIYLPCILVVLVSWIGFYIDREDTVDRISLGATSVLTMALLIMECKSDLPKIGYLTALDVYLVVCFLFILSSIIEFALVHYNTKFLYEQDLFILYRLTSLNRRMRKQSNLNSIENKNNSSEDNSISESEEAVQKAIIQRRNKRLSSEILHSIQNLKFCPNSVEFINSLSSKNHEEYSNSNDSQITISSTKKSANRLNFLTNLFNIYQLDYFRNKLRSLMNKNKNNEERTKFKIYNRVSKIDSYSRVLYPLFFILFNIAYWKYYLNQRDKELNYHSQN